MATLFLKHGETRDRKIPVNKHQTVYNRKEKYCAVHGWIDSFMVDEFTWHRLHANCQKDLHDKAYGRHEVAA